MKEFNLKELRELTKMTQKEFSDYLEIPIRTIQDWEANRRKPPVYLVDLINYKIKNEMENIIKFNEMKKEFGSVIFENKEYALTQNAYLSPYLGEDDTYVASAIDIEGNEYTVTWEFTEDARKAVEEDDFSFLEDESNMCDWDEPHSVEKLY